MLPTSLLSSRLTCTIQKPINTPFKPTTGVVTITFRFAMRAWWSSKERTGDEARMRHFAHDHRGPSCKLQCVALLAKPATDNDRIRRSQELTGSCIPAWSLVMPWYVLWYLGTPITNKLRCYMLSHQLAVQLLASFSLLRHKGFQAAKLSRPLIEVAEVHVQLSPGFDGRHV